MGQREMDRYGFGDASYVEMLWTFFTTVGAAVCAVMLWKSVGDMRWLSANNINGDRRLLAFKTVVSEAVNTGTLAAFALTGVWSMFIPSSYANGRPTALAIVVSMVFVLVAIAMTANALLRRHWNEEYIRRRMLLHHVSGVVAAPVTVVVDTTNIDSLEITTKAAEPDADAP